MSAEQQGGHFFTQLEEYGQSRESLQWEGTFSEYLDKVIANPDIVKTAHQLAYGAVTSRPDFFTTGQNALFGAEKTTERFIDVLRAGAQGLEIGKRIILLLGPPGSGKSTLVNGTKRGIEEYSETEQGALYAIGGCPMNEDPLHLVPKDLRPKFEEDFKVHVEGDLCPRCAVEYGDKINSGKIADVPVKRVFLSEKDRVGIGTFKPSDPKSQDITELTGSADLSKLGEYGSASDPRAFRFDGELNVANRGVMEFVEMLKSDERFLYTLLDLTQDKVIKAPRFPNISADEVILAHTNLAEYDNYVKNPKNEALRDRMVVVPAPYTLKVSAEHEIHKKLLGQSELVRRSSIHINPHTLETAAMFAVLTRLAPSNKYSPIQKMKIYDGQDVDGLTQRDLKELQEENPGEGMHGISPRYVIDSLSTAVTKQGVECLTPISAIRALEENIDLHPHTRDMKADEKAKIMDALSAVKEEFVAIAKKEIQSAFVYSFEETAMTLCNNYLDNVEAFCSRTKLIDPVTDEEIEPDEKLMRSIEEQIGIGDNGKKEFRSELMMRIASVARKGEEFDFKTHPRLKEAVENKLFTDLKDVIKITTGARVPNEEQQERIRTVERTLIEERGYCQHCAGELIRYVGTLLGRS
jgi:serine protein kinase